jgi:hypothetical protein
MKYLWLALTALLLPSLAQGQLEEMYWYAPEPGPKPSRQIPVFAKVELGLSLTLDGEDPAERYQYDGIRGLLTGPSGQRRQVLIFYYEPLQYGAAEKQVVYGSVRVRTRAAQVWQPADNEKPAHRWRMRFALDEPGRWQFQLQRDGRPWGNPIALTAVGSDHLSPLHFAPGERYLRDANQQSVFLMGHSLAYYSNQHQPAPYRDVRPDGDPAYARNTAYEYEQFFHELSQADGPHPGGNYARILLAPWTFDLEVDRVGDYDAQQNRAFDLDRVFDMAEARGIYLHLGLYDHVFFNDHPDPSRRYNHYHWGQNPYRTQLEGVEEVVDFFTDPEALAFAKQKLRYLIARYGYSPSFFCVEFFSETDNFMAANRSYYVKHQAEIDAWNVALGEYLHQLSDQVLATTGTMNAKSAAAVWDSPASDFSTYHLYQSIKNTSYFTYSVTQRLLDQYDKPCMLAEYGLHMTSEQGQRCGWDTNEGDPTTYSVMHNALWFSSFSGSFSTALIWYYWIFHAHWLDPKGAQFYTPLRAFFQGEDLGGLRPLSNACGQAFVPDFDFNRASPDACYPRYTDNPAWRGGGIYTSNDGNLQVFALQDTARVLGWVHNKNHYWYDLRHTATANNRDPEGCDPFNWPAEATGTDVGLDPYRYPLYRETMTLPVAKPGRYRLEWWHTYPPHDYANDGSQQGGVGRIKAWTERLQVIGSSVTVAIPPLVSLSQAQGRQAPDYGFKLIRID